MLLRSEEAPVLKRVQELKSEPTPTSRVGLAALKLQLSGNRRRAGAAIARLVTIIYLREWDTTSVYTVGVGEACGTYQRFYSRRCVEAFASESRFNSAITCVI